MSALLLMVGLSCTQPGCSEGYSLGEDGNCLADDVPQDTAGPDDTAEPTEPDEPPVPPWDADQVAGELDALLAHGLPEPFGLRELYLRMLSDGRDQDCPGDGLIFAMLTSSCLSAHGYRYYGIASYLEGDASDPFTDADWWFLMGQASFSITDPQGESFIGGGAFGYEGYVEGAAVTWTGFTTGSFGYPPEPGLIGVGFSSGLEASGRYEGQSWNLELSGSLAIEGHYAFFDALEADSGVCDGLPQGSYQLRTPEGYWYSLQTGEDCRPCGPASFAGQDVGEICFDLSPHIAQLADTMRVP